MEEQLMVKAADKLPAIAEQNDGLPKPDVKVVNNRTVVEGRNFIAEFDNEQGTLYSLSYDGKAVIRPGEGPELDALRAPVDNDNWAYRSWFEKGLHNLRHKVTASKVLNTADNMVQLMFTVESQAHNGATIHGSTSGRYTLEEHKDRPFGPDDFKFVTSQIWTVYPDGTVDLQSAIASNDASLVLPRLGYSMQLPEELSRYTYYGRGPQNNYNDRKTGAFIEQYTSTVCEQLVRFAKPQSMGNREDVRWCALTDASGCGVMFVMNRPSCVSALPWSALEMTLAPHTYQLPPSTGTHLHIDLAVTGLGGNSCGQGAPLEKDRVKGDNFAMGFSIRPLRANEFTKTAQARNSGTMPLSVSRSRSGMVTISSPIKGEAVCYALNGSKKVYDYVAPFMLREGGLVTAFYKNNRQIAVTLSCNKIETIPMEVVYASSQESGEGDAANLVDGDANTIWHTMYSVTVARYPHWVDFDAGDVKLIKGFVYLPRQDGGTNGMIKDYKLELSVDGKNWRAPVITGTFDAGAKAQRVLFPAPVKARYIRFTGLSSQNGQDFASGAEFSVLAE